MLDWVLLKKFCTESGYTEDAVHAKRQKGHWPENVVWKKGPDGHIFINVPAYYRWVAGTPPVNLHV